MSEPQKATPFQRGCGAHLGDDVAGISVPCGSLGRLCKRCQPWLHADTAHALPDAGYGFRSRTVYRGTTDACREKGGPLHASCMLLSGHNGDHYGSGYDEGGPVPALRWSA